MNWSSALRPCSLVVVFWLLPGPLFAADADLPSIARLWTAVKYFHPYIASRPIDWDKALVDALPAMRTAKNDDELRAGIRSLLAPLEDPLTVIVDPDNQKPKDSGAPQAQRTWIHHGLPSQLPSAAGFYQAFATKQSTSVDTATVAINPHIAVQIRLSEPVSSGAATPNPPPDRDYAETPFPSVEVRILSAFRIWGVIHNFFAYKDLMDEDWDRVFMDSLPKFVHAADARAYHLEVADMISRLSDSNSVVTSPELDRYFGEASVPFAIRLIEKRPVVTELLDASASASGLRVGDVVSAVDGERLSERIKNQARYLSVSTAQALNEAVVNRLLNGAENSNAELTVDHGDGEPRKVSLKRSKRWQRAPGPDIAFRILSGNIGYVNLQHLTVPQVDEMFDKLQNTSSIIFDARGPMEPLSSAIASCLATHPETITAIVTGPLALEPDLPRAGLSTTTSSYFFMETLHDACRTPYKHKTVMLIDERTIGNGEHLGLALGAANNTELLGTPSAGADSAVTEFTAPGGIVIRFSGEDIRNPNGGPIQRMGLQPSIALAPKIAAIRAKRDIVLEKAIEYLRPPATQALESGRSRQTRAFR